MLLSPGKQGPSCLDTRRVRVENGNCPDENKSRKRCKLGEAQQIVKRCADYVVEEMG